MIKIDLMLAEQPLTLMVSGQKIVQIFHNQQAIAFENPKDNYVEFALSNQRIGIDSSQIQEQSLSLFVDGVFATQLALPAPVNSQPKKGFLGLAALGFKLFKSAKVIKVALAGASVAGYAWLFSIEFALMLIACLVVHEYGHVRAMKYFGIKTKGIYLIPFVGGLAVSDDKITTRWQDVVISLMGPAFGLFTSVLGVVLYYATEMEIFAGVAVLSALLNLFNLLPILPLDGGHVLKSISFSMRSWVGLSVCLLGVLFGLWLSYTFGLMLLVFFLFVGALEIVFEWRGRHYSHLLPLDKYGQGFSAAMYAIVVAGHVAVMMHFADSENPILSLPMTILSS
ncbi:MULTISPECIES: metalloprotease [unclassified Pseudoalteromonas]|uniref:metalloprotease n=1 Tax=unclassified Pseudoalteromonas TaxID=194690 RepID=UPI0006D65E35|nr:MULTISPECIES: site-2 protease family protein [unclassified Pseudoalteromonas]KPZ53155.1 Stage IV sporulation protein FB [Pseudoalteromonas sp. P1-13-1a]KPZ56004.1 Stage IV sporulation protein FB [Pseudoalteromonas sp. P1-25]KPZ61724.1 Stage IV sporulation protein FB [Pseudoalteromonas sp. P1-7a]